MLVTKKAAPGLWAASEVPKQGWSFVEREDLGFACESCEFCGHTPIRFVCWIEHAHLDEELGVGRCCARKLTGQTEEELRQEQRFSRFRKRKWKVSQRGNPYLNAGPCNVVVLYGEFRASYRIADRETGRVVHVGPFEARGPGITEDRKRELFDRIEEYKARNRVH